MKQIHKLPENSAVIGEIPNGCKLCGPGEKMVLLITGKCKCRCFYCPLSFKKRGKGSIYANELKVKNLSQILDEAEAISAKGTGITGGDPMIVPGLTMDAIRLLKGKFGSRHHIHLYTSGHFEPKYIELLSQAGLDELRFHPPIYNWRNITKHFKNLIKAGLKTDMDIGVEIPMIPGYEQVIIDLAKKLDELKVNFLNLNELEFSESNWEKLKARGFRQKNEISSSVMASETTGHAILKSLAEQLNFELNVHYCSAQFKDRQQLTNRIKRRAKNVIEPHYVITEDGTFLIGIIESDENRNMNELKALQSVFIQQYQVPEELLKLNPNKKRLEIASWVLEELKSDLSIGLLQRCFIIEEYPTADRLEVERAPLEGF